MNDSHREMALAFFPESFSIIFALFRDFQLERYVTDQPTDRPTNQPTDRASYRGAMAHLKRCQENPVCCHTAGLGQSQMNFCPPCPSLGHQFVNPRSNRLVSRSATQICLASLHCPSRSQSTYNGHNCYLLLFLLVCFSFIFTQTMAPFC